MRLYEFDKTKIEKLGNDNKDALGVKTPTLNELSKKYGVPLTTVLKKVYEGIKVEFEHTKDEELAMEIAMDHLHEDLEYYTKLKAMEKR